MKRIDKLISIRKIFELREKEVARNLYKIYQQQKLRQQQIEELQHYKIEYANTQYTTASRMLLQRGMLVKLEYAIEYGQKQIRQFDHRLEKTVQELSVARSRHKAVSRLIEKMEQKQNIKEQLDEQQEVENYLTNRQRYYQ